ncbi:uncharacterized protein LOC103577119 [Microplitis demolitor]|uniref:uncharacterized protein LOC103577119 n=1 Tax=Microplitis demolitor TaxID=69319 RepID=UPI0004CC93C2|nr:uncharacterized protein LOC103577119 [Microplitis demolitor]XP_053594856.1 uncharacterized protein LOC103577119 [Microplitis demolitor]
MGKPYTTEDYIEMIELYEKNKNNAAAAAREFAQLHPDYQLLPKGHTIRKAVERRSRTGTEVPAGHQMMWVYVGDRQPKPRRGVSKRLLDEIMKSAAAASRAKKNEGKVTKKNQGKAPQKTLKQDGSNKTKK